MAQPAVEVWDQVTTKLNASVLQVCDTTCMDVDTDKHTDDEDRESDQCTCTNVVAVGLYQLEEREQGSVRNGAIQLFKVEHRSNNGAEEEEDTEAKGKGRRRRRISPLLPEVLETSGVFELKWYRQLGRGLHSLALAEANDQVSLHQVDLRRTEKGRNESRRLSHVSLVEDCASEDVFCLCVDVDGEETNNSSSSSSSGSRMVASTSDGQLHVVGFRESCLSLLSTWQGHQMETWAVAWDKTAPASNVCYSGADDGFLKGWDVREKPREDHNIGGMYDTTRHDDALVFVLFPSLAT